MKNLRKAISPILATVIIIAVTLTIALGVIGWVLGLWGSFSGGSAAISITNQELKVKGKSANLSIYIVNKGGGSDNLTKVEILYGGQVIGHDDVNIVIPANFKGWKTIRFEGNLSRTLNPGDTVIVKLYFRNSGTQQFPVAVVGG